MGHYVHHTIVVTAFEREHAEEARTFALSIFKSPMVTAIYESPLNAWATFYVIPDGSKVGWPDSDDGDRSREAFILWMRSLRRVGHLKWAEIQYGDDEVDTPAKVTAASNRPPARD